MDDREQFSAFVQAHATALQRSAWLLTGDWAAAEDLVQAALLKTWTRWSRIEHPAAAFAYTRTVMMRTFLGWRRRRWVGEIAFGWLPDRATEPTQSDVETRADLINAIAGLSPHQRAVIALRYFDDLSERDTAAVLGCSVGTVKTQASRALAKLRVAPGLDRLREEDPR